MKNLRKNEIVIHSLFLCVCFFVFSFACAWAQSVSERDALLKAVSLRRLSTNSTGHGASSQTPTLAYAEKDKEAPIFYVFNYPDGGFAIIAGDEIAKEVLGYCETGSFAIDSIPDGLKYMLQCYKQDILTAKMSANSEGEKTRALNAVSATSKSSISKMITTKWNQGAPYNSKLPSLGAGFTGDYAFATGCTATSLAQIMNYYKFPKHGIGSKSYSRNWTVNGVKKVITFKADFQNTTYDWDHMINSYSGSYTTTQASAVGVLMYHVGVAINAEYGVIIQGGTTAYHSEICPAMINYFGYNKNAKLVSRAFYANSEWENMVYNELKAGHPVWYSGQSPNGGHAFVCDGYDASRDWYHMNWGWGGYCDGYYPLTGSYALKPNPNGQAGTGGIDDYSSSQTICLGLYPQVVLATGLSLNKSSLSMQVGKTYTLTATVSPSNAQDKSVSWSSSDTNVATVSSSGVVTAKGAGSATITCKTKDGSGLKKTCTVTVVKPVSSITLSSTSVSLWVGNTKTLTATISPSSATNKTVTWKSSDTKVATVSSSGKITAVASGSCTITCTAADGLGAKSTCSVIVKQQVKSITLNSSADTLWVGGTKTLKATVSPSSALNTEVKWSSSDTSIAGVSSSGKITAYAKGSCVITCTAADGYGTTAKFNLTVKQQVTKITLNATDLRLVAGTSKTLTPTVGPSNASSKSVVWSSSDTNVATVSSSGKVTAVGPGSATIKCTAADRLSTNAKCTVTVSPLTITDSAPAIASATYGKGGLVYSKALTAGKYLGLCLPFDVDLSAYTKYFSKAYVPMELSLLKSDGNLNILFEEVQFSEIIPAGKPFLLLAKTTSTVPIKNCKKVKIANLTNPAPMDIDVYNYKSNGLLSKATNLTVRIGGTYTMLTGLNSSKYMRFSTDVVLSGTTSVNAYRFYIYKSSVKANASAISRVSISLGEDEATAIEDIFVEEPDDESIVFDLNGQIIDESSNNRGIFIKNGKKYIKK